MRVGRDTDITAAQGRYDGLREMEGITGTQRPGKEQEAGAPREDIRREEYTPREGEAEKPTGLYRLAKDGEGNSQIIYDDPRRTQERAAAGSKPAEEEPETCAANTDKVDREIRKLREEKKSLERQLRAAAGDEEKSRRLERTLAQVEGELGRKDNDIYRRQNTQFS